MSDLQCPVTLLVAGEVPDDAHAAEVVHVRADAAGAPATLDDLADLRRGETVVVVTDDVEALVRRLTGRAAPSGRVRVEGDADGWRVVPEGSPQR